MRIEIKDKTIEGKDRRMQARDQRIDIKRIEKIIIHTEKVGKKQTLNSYNLILIQIIIMSYQKSSPLETH